MDRIISVMITPMNKVILIISLYIFSNQALSKASIEEINKVTFQTLKGFEIINKYYKLETAEKLSRGEAQKKAIAELNNYRFDNGNYLNVFNPNGVMISSGNISIISKNLINLRDYQGNQLIKDAIQASQGKNQLTTYYWPKSDKKHDIPLKNLMHSRLFEPWAWIITSNIKISSYETLLAKKQFITILSLIEMYKKNFHHYPKTLQDLTYLDSSICHNLCYFDYRQLDSGYQLNSPISEGIPESIVINRNSISHTGLLLTNITIN